MGVINYLSVSVVVSMSNCSVMNYVSYENEKHKPPNIITITLKICSYTVVAAIFPKPTLVRDETMK